jgi:hypothetical protein
VEEEDTKDPNSAHLVNPGYIDKFSQGKVNVEAVPRFLPERRTVGTAVESAVWDILGLVLLNVLFALLAYLAFTRYDVR